MADANRIRSGHTNKPGIHRIKTIEILDMTEGADDVSITLTGYRRVTQPVDKTAMKALRDTANASPWTDDRLGLAFANRSLNTRDLKDPIKELQKFTDSLTRG